MDLPDFDKMGRDTVPPPFRKDRHPVFLPFPVPDRDLTALQVDVLHPQPQRLHKAETAPVHKRHRKAVCRFYRIQQPADLLPAQDDRQFPGSLRPLELAEVPERRTDDMLEVKDERVEPLALR